VKEKEQEKEKAFSEHTQEAFSALRDARGVGVAGVGVACRARLGVGLVVVVAMSLSLFTEHAGSLVDWLVRWLVLVLGHVYIRTMCTLVHTEEARVVAITRRSQTGHDSTHAIEPSSEHASTRSGRAGWLEA